MRFRLVLSAILIYGLFGLSACGGADEPFTYRYVSPYEVEITYQGASYLISPDQRPDDLPFDYEFEADGDVDIVLEGRSYEIDSPYDEAAEGLKKLTGKKSVKKKSSRTSSHKRR